MWTVVALSVGKERSYQEIAAMVPGSIATLRSRLHLGRRAIPKALWGIVEDQGIIVGVHPDEE
jgi:DNA-directed RNA polymerase specialized sigma24 family protein